MTWNYMNSRTSRFGLMSTRNPGTFTSLPPTVELKTLDMPTALFFVFIQRGPFVHLNFKAAIVDAK
jgi:hypothetical protein